MTTFQKTLIAYSKGQKSMAFIAYKNDPTANKNFTFSEFCAAFDKLIRLQKKENCLFGLNKLN
jgi:hypothetical protein